MVEEEYQVLIQVVVVNLDELVDVVAVVLRVLVVPDLVLRVIMEELVQEVLDQLRTLAVAVAAVVVMVVMQAEMLMVDMGDMVFGYQQCGVIQQLHHH